MKHMLKKNSVSLLAILLILILMALPAGYEDAAMKKLSAEVPDRYGQ